MTGEGTGTDDAVDPVDWQTARNLTGGDDELLGELAELFPQESAKHLANLKSAIAAGDGPGLTRAAHTLKSSAKLFGASVLEARALNMEQLGQASRFADADSQVPALESATRAVVDALARGPKQSAQGGA